MRQMPRDNAERVVTGARNLSPFLGSRMVAARLLGKAVFVRELLPQDLKLEIEHLTRDEAMAWRSSWPTSSAAAMPGSWATPTAHWLAELQRNRSKSLDAPSWLWNSVVELVGVARGGLSGALPALGHGGCRLTVP